MHTRSLTPADAAAYVALRREMLEDSPWAFAAGPNDDVGLKEDFIRDRLRESGQAIVGAFAENGTLVGAAGVHLPRHLKMAHRAHIWGVYVRPEARAQGTGERIMSKVLEVAGSWPGVTSAGLSVSVKSETARRLYERVGFAAWGLEPGALMLDGRAYDEVHMVAFLHPR